MFDNHENWQHAEMYFLELGAYYGLCHPEHVRNSITLCYQIVSIFLMPILDHKSLQNLLF